MAKGGEVEFYCSGPHDAGCEYFAGGGEIPADKVVLDKPHDEIPADKVILDKRHDEIPADKVVMDAPIPHDKVVLDSEKYAGTGNAIAAGIEGFSQGATGPLLTWAEMHPATALKIAQGPIGWGSLLADKITGNTQTAEADKELSEKFGTTAQDISGRQAAHPYVHGGAQAAGVVASLLTPGGPLKSLGVGAGKVASIAVKSKMGAEALKLFIEGAALSGADQTTKALLGQGNPEHPVGMAIAGGVLNVAGGGLFNLLGKGLGEIGSKAMVDRAERWLASFAEKPISKLASQGLTMGAAHYLPEQISRFVSGTPTGFGAQAFAYREINKWLRPQLEKIVGRALRGPDTYVSDAITRALLKENAASIPRIMEYARKISLGAKTMLPAVEAIFKAGSQQVVPKAAAQLEDLLKEHVENGKLQSEIQDEMNKQNSMQDYAAPMFAKGGRVEGTEPDHLGIVYPEQNILLNQARGRVYNYLNSIRPLPGQKLAFDETPQNREKKRAYDKAIRLAVNPLHILNHIQRGDLTPEDMKHFTNLYPELYRVLSGKLTEEVTKAQLAGKKPSYSKRQALSLFLGAPLDSSMEPIAIQAAQASFARKKMAQQAPQPKRKTAVLDKVSGSYRTDDQSREARQQRV